MSFPHPDLKGNYELFNNYLMVISWITFDTGQNKEYTDNFYCGIPV